MKSPITGKEMLLKKEVRIFSFRKDEFKIFYHYYLCETSGEQFTTDALDEINLTQLHNQYRDKHNLPFPNEVKQIRQKYGIPAKKMAEILGFGVNSYRNYENGEVPSQANGKLIQLMNDPAKFKSMLEISDNLSEKSKKDLTNKADKLIADEKLHLVNHTLENYLIKKRLPDEYTGYQKPNIEKLTEMVVYFSEKMRPWKTKLNKLLFYADFLMFRKSCYSISGLSYRAITMGPVPDNYNSIFEYLANNNEIEVSNIEFSDNKVGEQFKPAQNRSFNPLLFSDEELEVLHHIATSFIKTSTREIIELSHAETGWKVNQSERTLISYKHAFDLSQI